MSDVASAARDRFEKREGALGRTVLLRAVTAIPHETAERCEGLYSQWSHAAVMSDWQSSRETQAFLDIAPDADGEVRKIRVKTCARSLTRKGCVIERKLNALERAIARRLTSDRLSCRSGATPRPVRSCREGQGWTRIERLASRDAPAIGDLAGYENRRPSARHMR